ncbi:MAG: iron-containing alcohol dehydrogenase [Candidatus Nezhaarchaeota archaeon]|nr:iron-containing alcohol dehydrogenase [Candidatus Nezhaarchaeota archaeon]
MWTFVSPRTIVFGDDAIAFLENERASRVLIVTDETILRLGLVDMVKSNIKADIIEIFSEVEPEPSIDTALKCSKVARELQPDLIVAVGGGSVMDVAKTARVLMEVDIDPIAITPFLDLFELGYKRKARLIAIPTTSGTGADATWAVVLTDKVERRKLTPANKELIPDVTILDYRLVANMPRKLIAGSGFDALTHAIEGYLSVWRNDFSDALCEKAVELILDNLKKSYNGDMEARAKMHIAATMAGLGFGNSQVGLAHSLGHSLGGTFKLHHGLCVGIFLPYVMQFYLKSDVKTRMDVLAKKLGLADAEALIERIINLMQSVEMPTKLSEIITRKDFEENLEKLVIDTMNDASLGMSPRIPDTEQVKKIYEYSFEGRRIDF